VKETTLGASYGNGGRKVRANKSALQKVSPRKRRGRQEGEERREATFAWGASSGVRETVWRTIEKCWHEKKQKKRGETALTGPQSNGFLGGGSSGRTQNRKNKSATPEKKRDQKKSRQT